jgi:hypothetical protein
MAVKNLEILVLRGNRVAVDVVNSLALMGSKAADGRTPRVMFHSRHLSQRASRTAYESARRRILVDAHDEDVSVGRTGRSWGSSGVLVSRSPALAAGPAVLSGWSGVVRESRFQAGGSFGSFRAKVPASGSTVLSGRLLPTRIQAMAAGSPCWQPRGKQPGKPAGGTLAWFMPGGGTLSTSTRGTGAR